MEICNNLKTFSLAYFKNTVHNHVSYKICINQLMLQVRLLVNGRLLVVKFLGSQKLFMEFCLHRGVGVLTPRIVQGSTVLLNDAIIRVGQIGLTSIKETAESLHSHLYLPESTHKAM